MSFLPRIKCGKNSSRDPGSYVYSSLLPVFTGTSFAEPAPYLIRGTTSGFPFPDQVEDKFHGNDKNVRRKFSDLRFKNLRLVRDFAWKRGPLRGSLQMTFINLPLWRLCRNVILRLLPKLVLSGAKEPMRSFTTFRMMP